MDSGDENRAPREEAVREFLDGAPAAREWRVWRETLERRLADLRSERRRADSDEVRADLARAIAKLQKQIDALATEEIISEFVESEVDVALSRVEDGFEE